MNLDYLTLILTYRCKEKCPFCFIDKKDISMGEEIAVKIVESFLGMPGAEKTIKFFGGEPLLEFGLLKKIVCSGRERAGSLNKRLNFVLPTSGTLLNKAVLRFVKREEIGLTLDSYHLNKIKKGILRQAASLLFLTLTVNISPDSASSLFAQFRKFYSQGFSRFNFLPHYYINWPAGKIRALKREFEKIRIFHQGNPGLYFKNSDQKGDVPLFNSSLTADASGDIFSSNIILFKNLAKYKKEFFLGNIRDDGLDKKLTLYRPKLKEVLNKSFSVRILNDTFKVDRVLSSFVNSLQQHGNIADVKVGNSCNNRCKFCVRRKNGKGALDKTTSQIKRDLRDARGDCQRLVLTGGEPAIRNDFFDLLSYARRLGFENTLIQTNGRMFAYGSFCRSTIEAAGTDFEIAVHGHVPALHDYLTSSPGSFHQAVSGIRNLKALNQRVCANTVIVKSNYRHLPQIARLLVDLGVDQFQFAFIHAFGPAGDNFESLVPRISLVMPYVKQGLVIGIKAGVRVMTEAIPYCLMGGYEDYIAERIIPSTKIFELSGEAIDFDKIRMRLAKAKGRGCRRCRYFSACEGTWKEYPERFGWSEFNPA